MPAKHVLGDVCEVVRRSDVFHIAPSIIEIVDGWNPRTDFDGEDDLVDFIKAGGTLPPLLVRKTADKRLELVDGERRLRAALRAIEEGAELQSVPVIVARRGAGEAELFFTAIASNGGKAFTATEEAAAYRRLANWGIDVRTIAARSGKSVSHVRNRLELADASPEVKSAVDAGEITIGQAQQIARESDGKIDEQKTHLHNAKARPKARKLVLSFRKGALRETGLKGAACDPLRERLQDADFLAAIRSAGFDPESIRVTISPVTTEPKKIPLWDQTPDENGQYTCPECGEKVDRPDLCGPCHEAAAKEHRRNTVRERAALSEG